MTIALTFPGQGSQAVGMGRAVAEAFPEAREVFEEVDDALDQHLSHIMWEGPAETLTLTANAQPALMAVSLAVIRTIMGQDIDPFTKTKFVAGHSLGEYSALAAGGTFSISDTARLLRKRGEAMQMAVPVGEGAMAAMLGLDLEAASEVAEIAAQSQICTVANDNAPGQIVLSGHKEAVERATEIAKEKGARRALLLPVSAPFHCPLMAPAADAMATALAEVELKAPKVPVVTNVHAGPVTDPQEIKDHLVAQVTGRVRWRESIAWIAENEVETVIEIGTGKVLSGLAKRISGNLNLMSAGEPGDLEALLQKFD